MDPRQARAEFDERGFVRLPSAFPRAVAEACCRMAHEQLGIATEPPWPEPVVRGPIAGPPVAEAATSTRLVGLVDTLLDGRPWQPRRDLGNLVVRLPAAGLVDPGVDPGDTGWHVDASFPGDDPDDYLRWRVNHRSRGRALTLLVLLSDVGPDDAPTHLLDGSHRDLATALAPFGEDGVAIVDAPYPSPDGRTITEATGAAGDVYICHPLLVHRATWPNRGRRPRVLAQPGITTAGPCATRDRPRHGRGGTPRRS
jgi:hypothetical protein